MVARALASDRMLLLIPAWAYVACLVLAAALTRVRAERGYASTGSNCWQGSIAIFFIFLQI